MPLTDAATRRTDRLRAALEQPGASAEVLIAFLESLLSSGDRSGALQAYRRHIASVSFSDRSAEQRLRSLYEHALWSAPKHSLPTNAPNARYVMIGRDAEVHETLEHLKRSRVVSLAGPGGVGKTRVALEIARRALPEYEDGVWWIDLSAVDPEYCAEHLAHIIGASSFANDDAAIVDFLSRHRALLIFDTCERSIERVRPLVNRISASCPHVALLMTSRLPVGADRERVLRIEPLAVPKLHESERNAVLRSPAVQIFIERATTVDTRFAVTEENVADVAAICRNLGGLPLAIELAASCAGFLPLSEIAGRVLAGEPNLDAAIASSYELLDSLSRTLLDNLSLFSSGFSYDEAAAVAPGDVAYSLKRLIEASLLHMRSEDGAAEYYLLDCTRDFVRKRAGAPALANAASNAAKHYAQHAPTQTFPNVVHVLAVLPRTGENALLRLEILARSGVAFGVAGHVDETLALCESTLSQLPVALRTHPLYGDLQRTLAWLYNRCGRFEEALRANDEAISLSRTSEDIPRLVRALSNLYIISIHNGNYDLAREASAEALALSERTGDVAAIANALRAAAGCYVAVGDGASAIPLYERLLTLDVDRITPSLLAMALHDYALARALVGEYKSAQTLARRSAEVSAQGGDYGTEADAYNALGFIALAQGDPHEAFAMYRHALTLGSRQGSHPITLARTLEGCAACALREDQLEQAAQVLGCAEQLLRRMHSPLQPFERPRADSVRAAIASRLGGERFQAALLAGRTRTFRDIANVAARLAPGDAAPEEAQRFAPLTAREREIAERAADGLSNREIADALHLSVRTVENHLAAIYKKLGIGSRVELTAK